MDTTQRHTLSILVQNKFGVLARVAGLFSGRGYNIHTLNVGPSHDPDLSRMTIVVREKEDVLTQVIKQLTKLVDVIEVNDYTGEAVERELVMIKVKATQKERAEIVELCEIFGGKIADVGKDRLTLEMTGEQNRVNKFISMIEDFEIIALTRTGKIALPEIKF